MKNGHIKRLLEPDIQSPALEIIGANVDSNFIFSPAHPKKSLEIANFQSVKFSNVDTCERKRLLLADEA